MQLSDLSFSTPMRYDGLMAELIDGKGIAADIRDRLKAEIDHLSGRRPGVTMVLVGNNPASEIYVGTKSRATMAVGMHSDILRLPETLSEEQLLAEIHRLNSDQKVDGILVQLPLPVHITPQKVMMHINPNKDVDGFHPLNMGKLLLGDESGFIPCTPAGIFHLLEDTSGKHVVILGRSNIVGKPLAALLMQKRAGCNATVTVAHSLTQNLPELCRSADILVAAIGRPNFVDASMVREGAVVIDVGINRVDDRLVGDVNFDEVKEKCAKITPVPGGVGPMTVAMLLQNTWRAYSS